jgi:hypothetical protein
MTAAATVHGACDRPFACLGIGLTACASRGPLLAALQIGEVVDRAREGQRCNASQPNTGQACVHERTCKTALAHAKFLPRPLPLCTAQAPPNDAARRASTYCNVGARCFTNSRQEAVARRMRFRPAKFQIQARAVGRTMLRLGEPSAVDALSSYVRSLTRPAKQTRRRPYACRRTASLWDRSAYADLSSLFP